MAFAGATSIAAANKANSPVANKRGMCQPPRARAHSLIGKRRRTRISGAVEKSGISRCQRRIEFGSGVEDPGAIKQKRRDAGQARRSLPRHRARSTNSPLDDLADPRFARRFKDGRA